MKKVIFLSVLIFCYAACHAQQTDSTSKKLVPVESLTGKIRADTSKFPTDTTKVDTVYIDNPLNVIKAGMNFPSAFGFGYVSYERVLHFMGSIQVKLEYLGTYNPLSSISFIDEAYKNTLKINGIGIVPEARYYGSEKYAPKGIFVGFYMPMQFASVEANPIMVSNNSTYSLPSNKITYTLIGLGVSGGYQIILKNNITIEGLLGVAIARGKFSTEFYTLKTTDPNGNAYESKIALKDGTIGRAYYPRAEISIGYAF